MLKTLFFAAIGAAAFATAGVAAMPQNQGPEPYSAPDPVYTPHKIVSSVDFNKNGQPTSSATDSQASQPSDHS